MTDMLDLLLKASIVVFMAGNLLDMGLRLNPPDALRGLRAPRFVAATSIGPIGVRVVANAIS